MALIFVHGVNTRDTDPDHARGVQARRALFDRYVVPVAQRTHPNFRVLDDVYWGGLGVDFAWNLQSIPKTRVTESLGREDGNPDIEQLVIAESASAATTAKRVERLGAGETPLQSIARQRPGELVRAIVAPEVEAMVPSRIGPTAANPPASVATTQEEGRQLATLLIAVDGVARDLDDKRISLLATGSDEEILDEIERLVLARIQSLAPRSTAKAGVEHLGLKEGLAWATDRARDLVARAKTAVKKGGDTIKRAGSLAALARLREPVSAHGLRFFGDVFVYLKRGRKNTPSIYGTVEAGLKQAAADQEAVTREPLVVVSHSFGSMIVYDLLTGGAFDDSFKIDLWITVGSQTSLFAEMRLYDSMVKGTFGRKALGRPAAVQRWVNVYDAADILSYLHEPIFGADAVADVEHKAGANLANAHGAYFVAPSFYERVAQDVKEALA